MTNSIAFQAWPKIPRLKREILITEKIDGTNAAVVILRVGDLADANGVTTFTAEDNANTLAIIPEGPDESLVVLAQSRTRFVRPDSDNFGFAAWVKANASTLVEDLGVGYHYGEWWGSGIQRGYGLNKGAKRFSLFNVDRWLAGSLDESEVPSFTTPGLYVVPALYRGPWSDESIDSTLSDLARFGSIAAPGFDRPEGVVVWHYAARQSYKVLIEGDDKPKGPQADEEAHAVLSFVTESGSRYEVDPVRRRFRKVVVGDLLPSEVPVTDWARYTEFLTRTYAADLGLRHDFAEAHPTTLVPGQQVWFQDTESFVRTSPVVDVLA